MLYLLFFIDHNISSILTQSPKYNLKKPPAYHWDFFVLGLTIIPCGLLGLPPGSGLIPQAPLHTRALCTKKYEIIHGRQHEVFIDCEEQRWSAFFQAALMFVALSCMKVISWIPTGCLFGIFLYLGVGAMRGNEIWERIIQQYKFYWHVLHLVYHNLFRGGMFFLVRSDEIKIKYSRYCLVLLPHDCFLLVHRHSHLTSLSRLPSNH